MKASVVVVKMVSKKKDIVHFCSGALQGKDVVISDGFFETIERELVASGEANNVEIIEKLRQRGSSTDYRVIYNTPVTTHPFAKGIPRSPIYRALSVGDIVKFQLKDDSSRLRAIFRGDAYNWARRNGARVQVNHLGDGLMMVTRTK